MAKVRRTMSRAPAGAFLFSGKGAREQYVIFQTDVLHQIVNHLVDTVIHRLPGGAGFRRRRHVMGDVLNDLQQFTRFICSLSITLIGPPAWAPIPV